MASRMTCVYITELAKDAKSEWRPIHEAHTVEPRQQPESPTAFGDSQGKPCSPAGSQNFGTWWFGYMSTFGYMGRFPHPNGGAHRNTQTLCASTMTNRCTQRPINTIHKLLELSCRPDWKGLAGRHLPTLYYVWHPATSSDNPNCVL